MLQAEDGIRDRDVTGVQTCALPILHTDKTPCRGHKTQQFGHCHHHRPNVWPINKNTGNVPMTIAPKDGTVTPPPPDPAVSPTPLYPNNRFKRHLSELFRLALPVTIARLGMLIMSVVDTIVVGNYDSAGLAYLNEIGRAHV